MGRADHLSFRHSYFYIYAHRLQARWVIPLTAGVIAVVHFLDLGVMHVHSEDCPNRVPVPAPLVCRKLECVYNPIPQLVQEYHGILVVAFPNVESGNEFGLPVNRYEYVLLTYQPVLFLVGNVPLFFEYRSVEFIYLDMV